MYKFLVERDALASQPGAGPRNSAAASPFVGLRAPAAPLESALGAEFASYGSRIAALESRLDAETDPDRVTLLLRKHEALCRERTNLANTINEQYNNQVKAEQTAAQLAMEQCRLQLEVDKESRTLPPFGLRSWTAPELEKIHAELQQPIPDRLIRTKEVSGNKLSYVEVGEVIRAANRIFGMGNWRSVVNALDIVVPSCNGPEYIEFKCLLTVTLKDGSSVQDTGSGINPLRAFDAGDTARKSAVSDAIKRCLAQFGPALGLDLKCRESREELNQRALESKRLLKDASNRGPPGQQQQRRPNNNNNNNNNNGPNSGLAPALASLSMQRPSAPPNPQPHVQHQQQQPPPVQQVRPVVPPAHVVAQQPPATVAARPSSPVRRPVAAAPSFIEDSTPAERPHLVPVPLKQQQANPIPSAAVPIFSAGTTVAGTAAATSAADDDFLLELSALENSHKAAKQRPV